MCARDLAESGARLASVIVVRLAPTFAGHPEADDQVRTGRGSRLALIGRSSNGQKMCLRTPRIRHYLVVAELSGAEMRRDEKWLSMSRPPIRAIAGGPTM
jgi:hypothetical protein